MKIADEKILEIQQNMDRLKQTETCWKRKKEDLLLSSKELEKGIYVTQCKQERLLKIPFFIPGRRYGPGCFPTQKKPGECSSAE